jgi:hypothetical protein
LIEESHAADGELSQQGEEFDQLKAARTLPDKPKKRRLSIRISFAPFWLSRVFKREATRRISKASKRRFSRNSCAQHNDLTDAA